MNTATPPSPDTGEILIVEDSPTQALLLQNFLEADGFTVTLARSGDEALASLCQQCPHAVITDIKMPGMDGYALCQRIKTDARWQNIPVILLTSLSSPHDTIRGLECGADNFIVKPYDPTELLRRLRFSLEHRVTAVRPSTDPPVEIEFSGQKYAINADRRQILYFLLSTYKTTLDQNAALVRAREEVERSSSELARSNTELEQFSYVVSHDLQEPLRMVTSYLGLLEKKYQGKLDESATGFIKFAVDGARRMQNLIRDLLAYSRLGTRGGAFMATDLEAVLADVTANLSLVIQESRAVVTHDPLPTVTGDATQFGQLLQNLVGNALKFMGERPPVIHISAVRQHRQWQIGVQDNGIGIAPENFDRVFAVFQRLHTAKAYPGTGIGLSICKKIVERHGGRIWVESTPGVGTTFYFTIADAADSATGD